MKSVRCWSEESGLSGCQPAAGGYMLRNSHWQQGKGLASLKNPDVGDIRRLADKPAAGKCEDATNIFSCKGQRRSIFSTLKSGNFVSPKA